MGRFVFRYAGPEETPPPGAQEAMEAARLRIVDSSPKMYLVEGEDADVQAAARSLPHWTNHPERTYFHPDPKAKLG